MNTIFHIYIIGIILLVIGGIIYLFLRHQRNLKSRAFLMQEAIRNGDYSFRLSTKGLLFGERALQQALNDMENDIGRLVAQHVLVGRPGGIFGDMDVPFYLRIERLDAFHEILEWNVLDDRIL